MDSTYSAKDYWNIRYGMGLDSGYGSYGDEGKWKVAQVIDLAKKHKVRSILDCGCGDGTIAKAVKAGLTKGVKYNGFDISTAAIQRLSENVPDKMEFKCGDFTLGGAPQADLVMCLDVFFHLESQEQHDRATKVICESFKKVAVVTAWNEGIVKQYGGKFASHTAYRPFVVPEGIKVESLPVPGCPSKTFFILTR
jgi:SAM-dependent methyltransferase